MKVVSLDKKYRTQDWHEVRLDKIKPRGVFCVLGAAKLDGQWFKFAWRKNGTARHNLYDLVECSEELLKLIQKGLVCRKAPTAYYFHQLSFNFEGE